MNRLFLSSILYHHSYVIVKEAKAFSVIDQMLHIIWPRLAPKEAMSQHTWVVLVSLRAGGKAEGMVGGFWVGQPTVRVYLLSTVHRPSHLLYRSLSVSASEKEEALGITACL